MIMQISAGLAWPSQLVPFCRSTKLRSSLLQLARTSFSSAEGYPLCCTQISFKAFVGSINARSRAARRLRIKKCTSLDQNKKCCQSSAENDRKKSRQAATVSCRKMGMQCETISRRPCRTAVVSLVLALFSPPRTPSASPLTPVLPHPLDEPQHLPLLLTTRFPLCMCDRTSTRRARESTRLTNASCSRSRVAMTGWSPRQSSSGCWA